MAILAIVAAVAAGYRIFQQEQRRAADLAASRTIDASAEAAIVTISELKAALHAYVAEGQGEAFWTARAAALIERLRGHVLELDAPATAAGVPLTETLDQIDRVGAAERRARDHVRAGERLLAGEVIFTESRDLLDGVRLRIAAARGGLTNAATAGESTIRREQATLALAAAGILAFATLLLVIPPAGVAADMKAGPTPGGRTAELTIDDFESSARVVSRATVARATPAAPAPTTKAAETRGSGSNTASGVRTATALRNTSSGTAHGAAAAAPLPAPPPTPAISLRDAAAVCTDLGRVSQSIEISALLERAAKVLTASGAIVWLASPDRIEMYPAASAGYDDRLLARIGAITRDAANVTAAAFRDAAPRTSAKTASASAALAVPLLTPLGPVGVLSAEVRDVSTVDETRLAVATIFAAQLATLLGSMAAPSTPIEATGTESATGIKA